MFPTLSVCDSGNPRIIHLPFFSATHPNPAFNLHWADLAHIWSAPPVDKSNSAKLALQPGLYIPASLILLSHFTLLLTIVRKGISQAL